VRRVPNARGIKIRLWKAIATIQCLNARKAGDLAAFSSGGNYLGRGRSFCFRSSGPWTASDISYTACAEIEPITSWVRAVAMVTVDCSILTSHASS
jgi:hypothetical protein